MADSILTERKKIILRAIVDDYIAQGQPVGSRSLVDKYGLSYSPATIRAEMAALEEMGYLTHPHTSAGRIPTEMGYRFYIEQLFPIPQISKEELERISRLLSRWEEDLRDLLVEVCRMISSITTYTSIALWPQYQGITIKKLHFVPVSSHHCLMIIITNVKIIQSSILETSEEIGEEELETLSQTLTKSFEGKTPWQVLQLIPSLKEETLKKYENLLKGLQAFIEDVFLYEQRERLIVEGEENILLFAELQNTSKLRQLISALDRRFLLQNYLERKLTNKNLQVIIGRENDIEEMKGLSLLAMPFETSDYNYGTLGLVGPMRMDYAKAIYTLYWMAKILEKNLHKEESN